MNSLTGKEWVCVAPDRVVVVTADSAWLHQLNSVKSGNLFAPSSPTSIVNLGSPAVTRNLLDGAIAAAKWAASSSVRPPALSRLSLVWRLAGLYHLCHLTEHLMEKAAQRFASFGHECLMQWAEQKAGEEVGHDRWLCLTFSRLDTMLKQW